MVRYDLKIVKNVILELIILLFYYIIWIGDIIIYNWIYDIVDLDK